MQAKQGVRKIDVLKLKNYFGLVLILVMFQVKAQPRISEIEASFKKDRQWTSNDMVYETGPLLGVSSFAALDSFAVFLGRHPQYQVSIGYEKEFYVGSKKQMKAGLKQSLLIKNYLGAKKSR